MKKLLFLLSFLFLTTSSINSMQINITATHLKNVGIAVATVVGGYFIIDPVVNYLHALGHARTMKSLLNVQIVVDPTISDGKIVYDEYPIAQKGILRALCFAAGPLCGIATVYGLAKLNNIRYEYFVGNPILKAITNGLQKSFFNADQNIATKILMGSLLAKQLINFIPLKFDVDFTTDGYKIYQALNIIK